MKNLFVLFFLILIQKTNSQTIYQTEVLIVGGGTSGIAAGIQASRLQVKTIICEESNWLGGMLTAAGVSAIDGNHNLPSGLFGEFRNKIYQYYGGANKVATGWVSNTNFEPSIADNILKNMAKQEPYLKILYNFIFLDVIKKNNKIIGAKFINTKSNKIHHIYAKIILDASELGDLVKKTNIQYDIGMEADSISNENMGITQSNQYIQDLTYIAILKDVGYKDEKNIIKQPVHFNQFEFNGACIDLDSSIIKKTTLTALKMLEYAKLPNNKYILNWPNYGNDIYLNFLEKSNAERKQEIEKAKQQTLRFVYFIQKTLGYSNLKLFNEFGTSDSLAIIPYYRESRRIKGLVRFNLNHILHPFSQQNPLYRTGIGVGDYPIDHHHKKNSFVTNKLDFYPIPSFNMPAGIMIPKNKENIIVIEKSVSVSNIVNGTTRLQPCVMQIGQAGGVLAAICIKKNKLPHQIMVRNIQEILLQNNAYIMPYIDVPAKFTFFKSIQKAGATGIIRGTGIPDKWANKTFFYPDSNLLFLEFIQNINNLITLQKTINASPLEKVSLLKIIQINEFLPNQFKYIKTISKVDWLEWGLENFDLNRDLKRYEIACVIDKIWDLFSKIQVDINGHPIIKN